MTLLIYKSQFAAIVVLEQIAYYAILIINVDVV